MKREGRGEGRAQHVKSRTYCDRQPHKRVQIRQATTQAGLDQAGAYTTGNQAGVDTTGDRLIGFTLGD